MNQPSAIQTPEVNGIIDDFSSTVSGKYLTFNLAREEYGLAILRVLEIIGIMEITPVPRTPNFVLGVINLRGKVIPVIDLRSKFGLDFRSADERTCIIVSEVQSNGSPVQLGMVVDQVNEVTEVKPEEIEQAPNFGMDLDTGYILGLAKISGSVKVLLDIDKVLAESEISSITKI